MSYPSDSSKNFRSAELVGLAQKSAKNLRESTIMLYPELLIGQIITHLQTTHLQTKHYLLVNCSTSEAKKFPRNQSLTFVHNN